MKEVRFKNKLTQQCDALLWKTSSRLTVSVTCVHFFDHKDHFFLAFFLFASDSFLCPFPPPPLPPLPPLGASVRVGVSHHTLTAAWNASAAAVAVAEIASAASVAVAVLAVLNGPTGSLFFTPSKASSSEKVSLFPVTTTTTTTTNLNVLFGALFVPLCLCIFRGVLIIDIPLLGTKLRVQCCCCCCCCCCVCP